MQMEKGGILTMARAGENIYKRKDGRWEARYSYEYGAEGKSKYRSVYGKSRQEARQKRVLKIHEYMVGVKNTTPSTAIFGDLVNNWLTNTKLRVKASTFSHYHNQVKKHILPYLGKYKASKISTELIEQWINHLLNPKEEGASRLAPKAVEDILILVKNIMKFGKCYTHLDLHRIKIKKEDKNPIVLTKQEQARLHRFLVTDIDYIKMGVLLSLHIGIRIGELCALKSNNIDPEEKIIHIERTLQRIQITDENAVKKTKIMITVPKSKRSIRDIPMPIFLLPILRKIKYKPNCFLLTGTTQYMEPRSLYNHYKKYLQQSGVGDYKFHALRHTFSTNYIEAGFDVKSLSEILGHSNVRITLEKYVHSSSDLKRKNIEKLVEKLSGFPSEISSYEEKKAS